MAYSGVLDDVRTCSGRACPEGIPLGLEKVAVRFIALFIIAKQALPLQLKEISLQ